MGLSQTAVKVTRLYTSLVCFSLPGGVAVLAAGPSAETRVGTVRALRWSASAAGPGAAPGAAALHGGCPRCGARAGGLRALTDTAWRQEDEREVPRLPAPSRQNIRLEEKGRRLEKHGYA